METDLQVRQDFLLEAEEYFNSLESLLLDLDAKGAESSLLDTAMRSAHSLKGGAAMMQCKTLSNIAHRLEDFLKILRVRKDDSLVDREVTSLLLQGIDCMRAARDLHQQQDTIDDAWFAQNADPVFTLLRERLGDLKDEDEDILLAEEEQIDVSSLIFQSGVEECLSSFEAQIETLEPERLKAELTAQAEQLAEFGMMSQIEPFVQLCEAVQQEIPLTPLDHIPDLARQALKLWERSHALVLVGRLDKLPTQLDGTVGTPPSPEPKPPVGSENFADIQLDDPGDFSDFSDFDVAEGSLDFLETDFTLEELAIEELGEAVETVEAIATPELSNLNNTFAELDTSLSEVAQLSAEIAKIADMNTSATEAREISDLDPLPAEAEATPMLSPAPAVPDLEQFLPDAAELSDLDAAFANLADLTTEANVTPTEDIAPQIESEPPKTVENPAIASTIPKTQQQGRMVRVPVEQLEQLNNLSSRLILERNAATLRLNQLQDFVSLTRERMYRLEQSSNQLRKLYDWASMEGTLPTAQTTTAPNSNDAAWEHTADSSEPEKFDALEMDRYTDLHLLSQSQMETIVQLQEVTTDIDLGIREMGQVIRNFSYTTKELQQTVTRSQMRPFAELVGRFPRLIRDLSAQHDKQVELIIEGKTTQIDRQAMEYLSDPLTHLLRNAFDHGLEDSATRVALGKPATGKITLNAIQKGSQTIITIADDGGGINVQKIRDRLVKMGLSVEEVTQLDNDDVLDAIFEPGFSTAERVTELSGRGVGMDVVRSNLQQIRGDIQVKTELGRGTTFTIAIPLSLLVLRVVIVESNSLVFAIPVHSIKEIVEYQADASTSKGSQTSYAWQGQQIDLMQPQEYLQFNRPSKAFDMLGTPKIKQPIVLIFEDAGVCQGIYLDKYWQEEEVAIRTIKTSIPLFPGLNGSTVLGDGRVIPLIDPNTFYKGMLKQQRVALPTAKLTKTEQNNQLTAFPVLDTNRVLIVDDSVHVRRYLASTLERNGYQVEEAKDGQDAVDKLLSGLDVKAVICDVEMPRLDGYGVLSEIKSEAKFANLPIAMLTSRSNDKHRQLAMKLGASAYFSKPFNEQEMLQTLESLIEESYASV
ncbi:MAG: hybrid sensor histidine kinase/response regulator [Cyanobacteria bacterium J06623_7]